MCSNPTKANTAKRVVPPIAVQAVMSEMEGTISGNRATIVLPFPNPAPMITNNPPTSTSVMRPATAMD